MKINVKRGKKYPELTVEAPKPPEGYNTFTEAVDDVVLEDKLETRKKDEEFLNSLKGL